MDAPHPGQFHMAQSAPDLLAMDKSLTPDMAKKPARSGNRNEDLSQLEILDEKSLIDAVHKRYDEGHIYVSGIFSVFLNRLFGKGGEANWPYAPVMTRSLHGTVLLSETEFATQHTCCISKITFFSRLDYSARPT